MRLYLYIILSLISFNGFCQTNPVNDSIDKKGDYITEFGTMKFVYPIVFPNSFYVNPNIDSLNLVTLVGGSFYWHNGSVWTLISGGGGGGSYFAAYGLNLTGFTFSLDTTKAVTQTRLNNELSNITTLGIISTGVWQGTAIADAYISSASNWNAKQSALTFSNGVKNISGSVALDYTYAGVFTNTTWNGVPIGNSYLSNSSININGLSISLGGSGNVSDANLSVSDVVTNNSSTSQHGFIKKLNGISTYYMGGDGNWSIPSTTGTSLPNGDIWIGNSSSIATTVAMSGDATINNLGVLSLKNTGTAGTNGTSTSIPVFVTDAQGRVTSNTNTAIGTLNQNTTGSAATLGTARLLGGNSFDGSINVPFANKFIVQGTSDAGLTGAQFLGSLGTGIMKNTTTTGFVSIASAGTDYESPIIFSTGLTRVVNTVSVANTAVSAGSYTYGGFTVNAQGQLTSAASGTPPVTSVTGTSPIVSSGGATPAISFQTIPATSVPANTTGSTATPSGNIGYSSTSTASKLIEYDANSNCNANNFNLGYTITATAADTTTLTVSSTGRQDFTGTTTQTVVLPVTSTLGTGVQYTMINYSTGVVTVQSSGGTTLIAMPANSAANYTTKSTGHTDGTDWAIQYAANVTGVTLPAIVGNGRVTAQTSANASVSTYTVGSSDASFYVSANVDLTAATTNAFTVTCTYTNEASSSVTLTEAFTKVTGSTLLTSITNVTGVGSYEGVPFHIRAKTGTTITWATTGAFTSCTYNCEGIIEQKK